MTVDLYNWQNEKVGTVELPEAVFGVKWNPVTVKQVLEAQLANRRNPIAHAKGRGEVRGGGKKPWRQKGTGRARHGSIRSPLWRGGGKAHGPSKERDYSQKVNKKMKSVALQSVLSQKLRDGDLIVLENTTLAEPKTKILAKKLSVFSPDQARSKKWNILIIPDLENKFVYRAIVNLPKAKTLAPTSLNVYDILNHQRILVDQKAIPVIEKHYK